MEPNLVVPMPTLSPNSVTKQEDTEILRAGPASKDQGMD